MKNKNFAHLHLHTDASIRDGLGTVPRMIGTAKKMGFRQIAMTDHGTLANAITFSMEANFQGIKPLIGLEGYIEFDGAIGHITLLADGMSGWNSLLSLNNLAHKSEFRQPAFRIDELKKYNSGLICLTGCVASPFHQLSYDEAYRLGISLKKTFGYRLFAELMFVGDGLSFERSSKLASRLGLKKVLTNDVHFPVEGDGKIHPLLVQMKSGFSYDSSQLYLKSVDELKAAAVSNGIKPDEADKMLFRAGAIARRLGAVKLNHEPSLPKVSSGMGELYETLRKCPRFSLATRTSYGERLDYELDIVKRMKYEDYFLILDDILHQAKKDGVKIGPGRGSGAGSLILYILGITDVDPIKHGLKFERFLNPDREGMPDVDVDIDSENRQKVLDYASEKYRAVPIATYSRYSHKSLVRDLGKMFRVEKELINKAAEGGANSDEFKEIIKKHGPKFLASYESFLGQMRHKGKHAGGIIITDTPVPVERISDGLAAAWTEGKRNELSYAGIVKFDLLGLSVLSALRRLEEETELFPPPPVDFAPEFELFRNGDLSGIFQFAGSDGIRNLTMELAPTKFEELVAINALYRPGAIDSGSMEKYPKWKKSPRAVPEYIAEILEPTYGAIIYQEQVMEIFQVTVGGSLAQADEARRIITKSKPDDPKWVEEISLLRDTFINEAEERHGLSIKDSIDLWDELETHSRYSFNKAHSTAYAMLSWQCAWWKYNFPAKFYAAILNTDQAQEQTYIIDAVKSGIKIGPPHVNLSTNEWTSKGDRISMPLSAIKFLGQSGVEALVAEREAAPDGKFSSIEHFMEKVPKKFVRARARAGLFSLGGFKGLWEDLPEDEDLMKILALKEMPLTGKKRERQLKYLGFIVPDKKMLYDFKTHRAAGMTVGIINSIDHRESKWGLYTVYRLSPNGVFWSRKVRDLEKGQIVAVNVSEKNGRAKRIKIL